MMHTHNNLQPSENHQLPEGYYYSVCLFFELLSFCKRPRNDSHTEDKHEFNLQHISLLVIIHVRL